jgi:immunity protein 8 of polymorphic toxin system
MKATMHRLHSPDLPDLQAYVPDDPEDVGFLLQFFAGPEGQEGEESFDLVVCTPKWLLKRHSSEEVINGRHHLIVLHYDLERITGFIRSYVESCSGATWREVAEQLGRLGRWEFEDYRE